MREYFKILLIGFALLIYSCDDDRISSLDADNNTFVGSVSMELNYAIGEECTATDYCNEDLNTLTCNWSSGDGEEACIDLICGGAEPCEYDDKLEYFEDDFKTDLSNALYISKENIQILPPGPIRTATENIITVSFIFVDFEDEGILINELLEDVVKLSNFGYFDIVSVDSMMSESTDATNILVDKADEIVSEMLTSIYQQDCGSNCIIDTSILDEAYRYYLLALTFDSEHSGANFGAALIELLSVIHNPTFKGIIETWHNYDENVYDVQLFADIDVNSPLYYVGSGLPFDTDIFLITQSDNYLVNLPINLMFKTLNLSYNVSDNGTTNMINYEASIDDLFIPKLNSSLDYINKVLGNDFVFDFFSGALDDEENPINVEMDEGEFYVLKSITHLLNAYLNIINAYDLNINDYDDSWGYDQLDDLCYLKQSSTFLTLRGNHLSAAHNHLVLAVTSLSNSNNFVLADNDVENDIITADVLDSLEEDLVVSGDFATADGSSNYTLQNMLDNQIIDRLTTASNINICSTDNCATILVDLSDFMNNPPHSIRSFMPTYQILAQPFDDDLISYLDNIQISHALDDDLDDEFNMTFTDSNNDGILECSDNEDGDICGIDSFVTFSEELYNLADQESLDTCTEDGEDFENWNGFRTDCNNGILNTASFNPNYDICGGCVVATCVDYNGHHLVAYENLSSWDGTEEDCEISISNTAVYIEAVASVSENCTWDSNDYPVDNFEAGVASSCDNSVANTAIYTAPVAENCEGDNDWTSGDPSSCDNSVADTSIAQNLLGDGLFDACSNGGTSLSGDFTDCDNSIENTAVYTPADPGPEGCVGDDDWIPGYPATCDNSVPNNSESIDSLDEENDTCSEGGTSASGQYTDEDCDNSVPNSAVYIAEVLEHCDGGTAWVNGNCNGCDSCNQAACEADDIWEIGNPASCDNSVPNTAIYTPFSPSIEESCEGDYDWTPGDPSSCDNSVSSNYNYYENYDSDFSGFDCSPGSCDNSVANTAEFNDGLENFNINTTCSADDIFVDVSAYTCYWDYSTNFIPLNINDFYESCLNWADTNYEDWKNSFDISFNGLFPGNETSKFNHLIEVNSNEWNDFNEDCTLQAESLGCD